MASPDFAAAMSLGARGAQICTHGQKNGSSPPPWRLALRREIVGWALLGEGEPPCLDNRRGAAPSAEQPI
ncbi:hypothetical protein BKX93_17330 [Chromobacterium vaccinii]|uniref:Uncharacterized protein n=1 Tax=Chromobacterium vaccinii TaxID=1108595 RepID=A0A1D9LK35_9NEIS|nr:hypothetical protein BKX93_17330 [Chromobacterium vaccinii]